MHNDISVPPRNDAYSTANALMRHLTRIDLLLQDYYLRIGRAWSEDNLLSSAEYAQYSSTPPEMPLWQERTQHYTPRLIERISPAVNEPLGQIIDRFGLTDFEIDVLLLASLPHLDTRYHVLFSAIQGKKRALPTIGLALQLFCTSMLEQQVVQTNLLPQAPLFASQLLQHDTNTFSAPEGWGQTPLLTCPEVWHFLLGNFYQTSQVNSGCHWLTMPGEIDLTQNEKKVCDLLQPVIFEATSPAVVILRQATDNEAAHVLTALGFKALRVEFNSLLANEDEKTLQRCRLIIRNARLHQGGLILHSLDELKQSRSVLFDQIALLLVQANIPLIYLPDKHAPLFRLPDIAHFIIDMPASTLSEREEALAQQIDNESGINIQALSRRFSFTPDEFPHICREARFYSQLSGQESRITQESLHQTLRYRARQNFGNLAQRIEPKRSLDDLIISAELRQHLAEINAAIRHRETLLEQGFRHKIQYGTSISALFYGPSGTGKTMAAEVLAHSMQTDLIKIDLSTVVNKYIGETEKNLAKIFDLAQTDAGVLFFDEADALFGKRTQVKDSKDRHANIEVSYLLQRLENFPGLVILATNNRNHLDEAFTRRLTFITHFPSPDAEAREKIWRSIWPDAINIDDDVDFSDLANRIDVTGANIRNIALLASWLALEESSATVTTRHIEQATSRELTKMGRLKF